MFKLLSDLRRIITITEDLLFLAGRSLQRRAFRNGFVLALAYGSTLLGVKVAGAQQLSQDKVLLLLVVAFASYPTGTLLVHIANFLTRGNLSAAAAGHQHLTSHYKQSNLRIHLERLWVEVFSLEASMRRPLKDVIHSRANLLSVEYRVRRFLQDLPTRLREDLRLASGQDVDQLMGKILSNFAHEPENIEATKELFIFTATYALSTPMPLTLQNREVGFDVSPLEDWYEKGLFTYEDYPRKAFGRDVLIQSAQRMVKGKWFFLLSQLLSPEPMPSFWYAFTARKSGVLIGKCIRELNANIPANSAQSYFGAQHIIWPSQELDHAVGQDFGDDGRKMLALLIESRHRFFTQLFSDDSIRAKQHVFRLFERDFKEIYLLRLQFDIEFAANSLAVIPASELKQMSQDYGRVSVSSNKIKHARDTALSAIKTIDRVCRSQPKVSFSKEQIRSLSIACYINLDGIHDQLNQHIQTGATPQVIHRECATILPRTQELTDILVRLRCYYCMTKLHIDTYWQIISALSSFRSQHST